MLSILAVAIHCDGLLNQAGESVLAKMLLPIHRPHNLRKRLELEPLIAKDWMGFEEGNDFVEQIPSLPDHVYKRLVPTSSPSIGLDVSATQIEIAGEPGCLPVPGSGLHETPVRAAT